MDYIIYNHTSRKSIQPDEDHRARSEEKGDIEMPPPAKYTIKTWVGLKKAAVK